MKEFSFFFVVGTIYFRWRDSSYFRISTQSLKNLVSTIHIFRKLSIGCFSAVSISQFLCKTFKKVRSGVCKYIRKVECDSIFLHCRPNASTTIYCWVTFNKMITAEECQSMTEHILQRLKTLFSVFFCYFRSIPKLQWKSSHDQST